MSSFRRVAITTGDADGVGLEVSVKALTAIGPQAQTQFCLYRSLRSADFQLPKKWKRIQVLDLQDALSIQPASNQLIEIVREDSPACWVEEVGLACLRRDLDSMVTGPLSKQEVQRAGMKDIGHTDILKRISRKKNAFMTFMGPRFNVLLVTGHLPVQKVESALSEDLLRSAISSANEARKYLPRPSQKKPIAVLGLNPHAGDQGLIGQFDQLKLSKWLKKMSSQMDLSGPLVPDVAFLPENWKNYSFYVAQYHDQGLIPFKMIHGFDAGVHLTLGLPIKRSSVDHGTAKDLYGLNKANPGSMIEAIRWGVRLAHKG